MVGALVHDVKCGLGSQVDDGVVLFAAAVYEGLTHG